MNNDKKYTIEQIQNLRLCSAYMPDTYYNDLNKLNSLRQDTKEFNKYRSVFFKTALWTSGQDIKIQFIGIPYQYLTLNQIKQIIISFTDIDPSRLDPLQLQFSNEYTNIIGSSDTEYQKILNIQSKLKEYVKKVILERFKPICNLNFIIDDTVNVPNSQYQIRISFVEDKGANSRIAKGALTYTDDINNYFSSNFKVTGTLNLGWFDIGTVIHEFGHAIGLCHEHQNPCGFKPKWNLELLYTYFLITDGWKRDKVDFNIVNPAADKNDLSLSIYDPKSIMVYFYKPELTLNGIGTENTYKLSPNDCLYISKIYKIPGLTYTALVEWYNNIYSNDIWSVVPGTNINLTLIKTYTIWDCLKLLFFIIVIPSILYCLFKVYNYYKKKRKEK